MHYLIQYDYMFKWGKYTIYKPLRIHMNKILKYATLHETSFIGKII